MDTLSLNRKKTLNLRERILIANTHKAGEPYEKHGMKTMAIILYLMSFTGVVLQAGDIITGIPDRYAGGTVVAMLIAANAIQWRQSIKDRLAYASRLAQMQQEHRAEIVSQQAAMMTLVENNQKAIQEILKNIK